MKKANFDAINAINERERERESSSRLSEIFGNSPSIASGHNAVSSSIVGGDSTHSPSLHCRWA